MAYVQLCEDIINTALALNSSGINQGSSGNVSVRVNNGFLITPSGMQYRDLTVDDIVFVDFDGRSDSPRTPSSEWRFHCDIYCKREDVDAVVHTHSTHATALACLHKSIPAFHYMVAVAGGNNIRCAPYATYGTQELSDYAVAALSDRKACLLGNHGVIATGKNLAAAFSLASEVESLSHQYIQALNLGEPVILSDEEMKIVVEKFKSYGANAQKAINLK